jgi:MFS family permease
VGLTFAAAALASAYGGLVAMRFGSALATQLSMVVSLAGLALFALPHVVFVALGSVAVGVASGLASPAASWLLANYTPPQRRNLMFSIKQTGVPLGGVLVALTAPLLAVHFGWRWALLPIAVMAVATLVMTERARAIWDRAREQERGLPTAFGGVPLVWRERTLRWVAIAAVLFSSAQRILLSFTVVYLVAEGGYGLVEAGVMLSIAQIGGSVFRIPWGWLADRLKSGLAVLIVICVIMILSSVLLVALDPAWPRPLVMVLFFVLGISSVGWNGIVHAECARLSPPGMVSLVAGGTSFFVFAGVMLGPSVFAAAYPLVGSYAGTFSLMVICGVAALALLVLAHRRST